MILICHHCTYEWDYKGKEKHYATCPKCLYKVNLKTAKKKRGKKNV